MKRMFFIVMVSLISVSITAQRTIEIFRTIDCASSLGLTTNDFSQVSANQVLYSGSNINVKLPFAEGWKVVSTEQPNGAHKNLVIDGNVVNIQNGMQAQNTPKDSDGNNPANSLECPTSGAAFQIDAQTNGLVFVVCKASSNKPYFVFSNSYPMGYALQMQTYASPSIGNNGILSVVLSESPLTAANLLANTGFNHIEWVENYNNDPSTSGVTYGNYKQNGVCVIGFNVIAGCSYLVGAGGSKIPVSAIIYASDMPSMAFQGETVIENGVSHTYQDVTISLPLQDTPQTNPDSPNGHSGTCGPNVVWTLQNGVLEISGMGGMEDGWSRDSYPWYPFLDSINSVIINNGVTSIGAHAFEGYYFLSSVTIANSVEHIGGMAFAQCRNLSEITLPNAMTSIEAETFMGCENLTSITIPNTITHIGTNAFDNRVGMKNINEIHYIGSIEDWISKPWEPYYISSSYDLFIGDSLFTDLIIPNTIDSIDDNVFWGCTSITSLLIPQSIVSIGDFAFINCGDLTSMNVDANNVVYDSRNNCNAIIEKGSGKLILGCKTTIIPSGITCIGQNAFYGRQGLTSISIPESVSVIEGSAFYGSSVTSVVIPSGLDSIGWLAFEYCGNLDTILCKGSSPAQIGTNLYLSPSLRIIVPCGAVDTYKSTEGWNYYADRIQVASSLIQGVPLVEGTGIVRVPETVCENTIEAIPAEGYHFVKWTDGNTDNPRVINPEVEATYIAEFAIISNLNDIFGENNFSAKKAFVNGHLYILLPDGTCFDATGKKVE